MTQQLITNEFAARRGFAGFCGAWRRGPVAALMVFVVLGLLVTGGAWEARAQGSETTPTNPSAPPRNLRIVILDGEDATNNIRRRVAREPIVQVVDLNNRGKPVPGVSVRFILPGKGASGKFGSSLTFDTSTDSAGQARAEGLRVNYRPGKMQIQVTASAPESTASATAVITQTNVLIVLGVPLTAAAVAVGGGIVAGGVIGTVKGISGGRKPTAVSVGVPHF